MALNTAVRKWALGGALPAILVLATWLRLHGISDKSLWTDEGVSAAFTRLDWFDFGRILWRREGNMTLYYLLLRAWTQMGDSVAMIRGFSVLWSVGTVVAVFALSRKLFGDGTGLVAALLMAVNAYSVRYAQEARSYSMVAFLVTLATYFLVRAIESGRKRDWTWYVVASSLGVYAHFFAVLVTVAHALVVWWALPTKKSEFLQALKKIGWWTLPVWVFIATTGAGPIAWITRQKWSDLVLAFRQYAGNAGAALAWLYLGLVSVFVIATKNGWKKWLLLAWFAVPVAITLMVSLARPVFLARYMNICLPALVLMVAAGVTALRRWWIAAPVAGLICWFALAGVRSYYVRDFDIAREDCRSATAYVLAHARQGDTIAFHKGQNRFVFSYYAVHMEGVQPAIVYPGGDRPTWHDFFDTPTPQVLHAIAEEQGRVWLVISQTLTPAGEDVIAQEMKDAVASTHHLAETKEFSYLKVYLFNPQ
jgi:mannosyltransferase